MCIGGRLGAGSGPGRRARPGEIGHFGTCLCESASRLLVSVQPDLAMLLDALSLWRIWRRIGTVTGDGHLT